jgi:choice-of-anchor A domain-containing protein
MFRAILSSRSLSLRLQSTLLVACLILCIPTAARAEIPSLGSAGNYAVLGADANMTFSSGNTTVTGNVGLGHGGQLTFSGGGLVTGRLDRDTVSSVNLTGGSSAAGGIFIIDTTQITADAMAASVQAASLSTTDTRAAIGNGATFTSTGALNVIDVTGNIQTSGGGTITITGGANDFFVFNVHGTANLTGGSSIALAGGITPGHVLWNFVGTGGSVQSNGNSNWAGTVLALNRDIVISGGVHHGAFITGNQSLTLQSGPSVVFVPLVPAPATGVLVAAGMFLLGRRPRR